MIKLQNRGQSVPFDWVFFFSLGIQHNRIRGGNNNGMYIYEDSNFLAGMDKLACGAGLDMRN